MKKINFLGHDIEKFFYTIICFFMFLAFSLLLFLNLNLIHLKKEININNSYLKNKNISKYIKNEKQDIENMDKAKQNYKEMILVKKEKLNIKNNINMLDEISKSFKENIHIVGVHIYKNKAFIVGSSNDLSFISSFENNLKTKYKYLSLSKVYKNAGNYEFEIHIK